MFERRILLLSVVMSGVLPASGEVEIRNESVSYYRSSRERMVRFNCYISGITSELTQAKGEYHIGIAAYDKSTNEEFILLEPSVGGGSSGLEKVATITENGSYWFNWMVDDDLGDELFPGRRVPFVLTDFRMFLYNGIVGVQFEPGHPFISIKNIGAKEPQDAGFYFWWGDTVGYKYENGKWVASDGSCDHFAFNNYYGGVPNKNRDEMENEGWIKDGVLAPEYDAAAVHLGGNWRMPTVVEFMDLSDRFQIKWVTENGVNGCRVAPRNRGMTIRESTIVSKYKSIFLPVSGCSHSELITEDGIGYYWSSSPCNRSDYSYSMWSSIFRFSLSKGALTAGVSKDWYMDGLPIRPVMSCELASANGEVWNDCLFESVSKSEMTQVQPMYETVLPNGEILSAAIDESWFCERGLNRWGRTPFSRVYPDYATRIFPNGLTVVESYIAGLYPLQTSSQFRLKIVPTKSGGFSLVPSPFCDDRVYTLMGTDKLGKPPDLWARGVLGDAEFIRTNKFFKVSVRLPSLLQEQ